MSDQDEDLPAGAEVRSRLTRTLLEDRLPVLPPIPHPRDWIEETTVRVAGLFERGRSPELRQVDDSIRDYQASREAFSEALRRLSDSRKVTEVAHSEFQESLEPGISRDVRAAAQLQHRAASDQTAHAEIELANAFGVVADRLDDIVSAQDRWRPQGAVPENSLRNRSGMEAQLRAALGTGQLQIDRAREYFNNLRRGAESRLSPPEASLSSPLEGVGGNPSRRDPMPSSPADDSWRGLLGNVSDSDRDSLASRASSIVFGAPVEEAQTAAQAIEAAPTSQTIPVMDEWSPPLRLNGRPDSIELRRTQLQPATDATRTGPAPQQRTDAVRTQPTASTSQRPQRHPNSPERPATPTQSETSTISRSSSRSSR